MQLQRGVDGLQRPYAHCRPCPASRTHGMARSLYLLKTAASERRIKTLHKSPAHQLVTHTSPSSNPKNGAPPCTHDEPPQTRPPHPLRLRRNNPRHSPGRCRCRRCSDGWAAAAAATPAATPAATAPDDQAPASAACPAPAAGPACAAADEQVPAPAWPTWPVWPAAAAAASAAAAGVDGMLGVVISDTSIEYDDGGRGGGRVEAERGCRCRSECMVRFVGCVARLELGG
ncbi:hypothetical protein EJ06DRAFT_567610 [Trichodelitschia bisporula]|uniref:Uncharacterized protein n=1 Tax=Trichodelitschia bisporula TaxID=703511 RepID=A0A6G1HLY6_9PEZI|nr:hypothetical protein EJ06DRAFT_567610 [Trichodelitschia bisporula]